MRKRSILKLEQVVKYVYSTDKSSDEMYTSLYNLISAIITIKNIAFNYTEVDEISHRLATDVYLRLNDGSGWTIKSWTKYLWLRSKDYRDKYVNETSNIELVVDDPVDLDYFITNTYKNMNRSLNYESLMNKREELLEELPSLMSSLITKYIKYTEDHVLFRDIVISVKSTIYSRLANNDYTIIRKISLFHYDEIDYSYIGLLSNIVISKLLEYLDCNLRFDILSENIDTLKQICEFNLKESATNVEI